MTSIEKSNLRVIISVIVCFFIFYMVMMSIVAGKVEEINQKKCDRIINNADVHAYISNDDICEAVIIKNNHLAN